MKLTAAQLAEIRDRDARAQEAFENFWDSPRMADCDRQVLLAHIDELDAEIALHDLSKACES